MKKIVLGTFLVLWGIVTICQSCNTSKTKDDVEKIDSINIFYRSHWGIDGQEWTIRNDNVIKRQYSRIDNTQDTVETILSKPETEIIKEVAYRLFVYHTSIDIINVHNGYLTDLPSLGVVIYYKGGKTVNYNYDFGYRVDYSPDFENLMNKLGLMK